ncbi:chromosome segregation protein Spc25-domain-containing protein [Hyaloraphidium curvatum]|nr:chromosome segregation protein Spc25-domain-containing protein [Hyaloraphidium curvatum]
MAAMVAGPSASGTTLDGNMSLTDEIRNSNRIFQEKFNAWFTRLRAVVGETQAAFRKDVNEYREQAAQLQRDLEAFSAKETEMTQLLDSERRQVAELQDKILEAQQHFEELKQKTQEVERAATHRERANRRETEALERRRQLRGWQSRKNEPELRCYEEKLKLTVATVKPDVLSFTFQCVDPADFAKEHRIVVEILDQSYTVSSCQPPLAKMDSIVSQLNGTRDFYGFLKRVRKEFEALYSR